MNLENALLDLYSFRLRIVGRKQLSSYQVWQEWLKSE